MYENYVSLGINCEAAFQIRRILGKDSSGFFSWNVTGVSSLLRLLDNGFDGILRPENLVRLAHGAMIEDKAYGYLFHSPFEHHLQPLDDPDFEAKLASVSSKSQYFVEKFNRLHEAKRTAFFYKPGDDERGRDNAVKIRDALKPYFPAGNFDLVYLDVEANYEPDWKLDNIYNRHLRRIAPWEDASDGHVHSWDKIFREFPYDGEMRFSGY